MRADGKALFALAAAMLLTAGCSSSPDDIAGGSSTEIPNGVTATVTTVEGTPAAGVTVRLRPADYLSSAQPQALPSSARDTITGDSGRFAFDSLASGEYRIEVTDGDSTAVMVDLTLGESGGVTELATLSLRHFAHVQGAIDGPGLSERYDQMWVQIYGLERLIAIEPDGSFQAGDLPEGRHELRLHSTWVGVTPRDLGGVDAAAGDTATIEPASPWSNGGRLYLNTTASGAFIGEHVIDMPLFVSLDSAHVDFSQAAADGSDLFFYNARGMRLPRIVESWDSAAGTASLWVGVDTVFANDSTQFIEWFAGAGDVMPGTSPADVFGGIDGVTGAWSFDGRDPFADRSGTGNDAGDNATIATAGVAGEGRECVEGSGAFIALPASTMGITTGRGAIELWIRSDSLYPQPGMIFYATNNGSDGYGSGIELHLSIDDIDNQLRFDIVEDSTVRSLLAGTAALDGQWHHVAATWDTADSTFIYVDGAVAARDRPPVDNVAITQFAALGKPAANRRYYHGAIDEITYYTRPPSPARLKLRYENLRVGSKLISAGPAGHQ